MTQLKTLDSYLTDWAAGRADRRDTAITVKAIAQACTGISDLLARGALATSFGAMTGRRCDIDPQRELDVLANDAIIGALKEAPVALLVSEELDEALPLREGAALIVTVDPLDGASNADTNAAIGTIFSVLPNETNPVRLSVGTDQLAAGFAMYGPQTVFALTVGAGTLIFTLNRGTGHFEAAAGAVTIPPVAAEFAINAANHWHWDEVIRTYVDDCLAGKEGPRGADFNMRWTGSFVAEVYRILIRGGVYLYPGDRRKGYANGRLRLVYEASPVAWVIEQAQGAASTGRGRILEQSVLTWHQRTPVIIGSRQEVAYIERLQHDPHTFAERSPLFGRRGLFRV